MNYTDLLDAKYDDDGFIAMSIFNLLEELGINEIKIIKSKYNPLGIAVLEFNGAIRIIRLGH